jgi:ElaB/YqjD/DUF883 family membrane-anchored ribosome-binding protein
MPTQRRAWVRWRTDSAQPGHQHPMPTTDLARTLLRRKRLPMIKPFNTPDAGGAVDPNSVKQAVVGARQSVDQTLDHLGERVDGARAAVGAVLDGLAGDATRLTERGSDAVRDTARRLREQALDARESARGYVRDEPLKSVLIAMAAGAALMVLGGLLSRGLRGPR